MGRGTDDDDDAFTIYSYAAFVGAECRDERERKEKKMKKGVKNRGRKEKRMRKKKG